MIIRIEQTEHPDHINPIIDNNKVETDQDKDKDTLILSIKQLKADYEQKEKILEDKIFSLEYDKRELEYKVSISYEEKQVIIKEHQETQSILNSLKSNYDSAIKSTAVSSAELNELQLKLTNQAVKHDEEINKRQLEFKALNDSYKKLKKNYAIESNEKKELEEVVFEQENKVQKLQATINQLEKNIKEKENIIQENYMTSEQMKNIIENQKKTISSIQKRAKIINTSPLPNNELLNLQNQIKILKKDNEQKEAKIGVLQMNNRILNSKIAKAKPLQSLRSGGEIGLHQQQIDYDRAVSAIAETNKKKRLDNKSKGKDKIPLVLDKQQQQPIQLKNNQQFDFFESDPVYCEPSLSLNFNGTINTHNNDFDIDNFLKKPMNDYKVLQPIIPHKERENVKDVIITTTNQSAIEFPIIESYSVLKSQSEIFDKDDSKVEELQVMVKKLLEDF